MLNLNGKIFLIEFFSLKVFLLNLWGNISLRKVMTF